MRRQNFMLTHAITADPVYGAYKAAVAHFTKLIGARSAAVIARGKQAFYRQIDLGLEAAYAFTGELMACSVLEPEADEGIDAFVEKRAPKWDR